MRALVIGAMGLLITRVLPAMDVKGLRLGAHTSLSALSSQFGHADCPDRQNFARLDVVLPDLSGTRTLDCHVPTTYLGFAGTATISVDRGFVIKGLTFPIPAGQDKAVTAALEKRYGAPTSRKGDAMDLVEFDAKGAQKTTTGKNPCTTWKQVEDASVMVCPGQVTYTYVGTTKINTNDL